MPPGDVMVRGVELQLRTAVVRVIPHHQVIKLKRRAEGVHVCMRQGASAMAAPAPARTHSVAAFAPMPK